MLRVGRNIKRLFYKMKALGLCANIHPKAEIQFGGKVQNILGEKSAISLGAFSIVQGRLLTYGHGGKISIGEDSFIGPRTEIWSMDSILVGDRVLISHDVNIHDGTGHSKNCLERHQHFKQMITTGHPRSWGELPGIESAPIIIEDDVWINFGVTILKGVRIGSGSIIAAGSLVTENVPSNSLFQNQVVSRITDI